VSQWNISVRLTGQGAGLSRTLKNLSRDARDASRDVAQLRRDITYLRTQSRHPIRLKVRVDASHLRDDIQRAAQTAQRGQGVQIRLRVDATSLRAQVRAAIRTATRGQSVRVPIRLDDTAQLRRQVSRAARRAETGQTIRIRVTADTSGLTTTTTTAGTTAAAAAAASSGASLKGLLTLLPALVPLTAGLTANLGAVAAQAGTATVALGAYGVALGGQISELSAASEAHKSYRQAVSDSGAGSAEAATAQLEYQKQLSRLTPATQSALISLGQLKSTYSSWSDELSQFTMAPVEKGFVVLKEILPKLTPLVKSTSRELDRLVTVAGGGVTTPGFDAMFDRFSEYGDGVIRDITDSIIHLFRTISDGSVDDGAIGSVLDYMRENGPAAREAINDIGDAIGNIIEAGSLAGPVMLTLVSAAARLVAALPPEAVAIILQTAAALKLLTLAGAGAAAVATRIGALRTAIMGLAAASTAAGGGLAGLRAAFLSLGTAAKASIIVAGIAAAAFAIGKLMDMGREAPPNIDKLTTSLGKLGLSGKVGGELARGFGKDLDGLYEKVRNITDPSVIDNIQNGLVKVFSLGMADSTPSQEAREWLDSIDEGLTNLVRDGKADVAAAAYERLKKAYAADGKDVSELTGQMDSYKSALEDLKFEQELAAASMGIFGQAAMDVQAKLNAQKTAADGLRQSLLALNETNRSAYDAEIGFEQAMDDLTAAFKENGNTLDLNTEAGRKNGQAMSAAAKSQDEMIAAGLAAGESMESMAGKSDKLRESMLTLATQAFDGNRQKAVEYVNTLLGTPADIKTIITLERQEAINGLNDVQNAINATPDSHTVTVDTLNATAIAALEAVGLKTRQLPDGRTEVYTANGQSLGAIGAVDDALNRLDGKTAHTYTTHTTTFYENHIVNNATGEAKSRRKLTPGSYADGALVDYYADGGIQRGGVRRFAEGSEKHVAQIAPAGSWRVWAEPETMGEAYIPLAPSKRGRSRAILEETARRLGGDPAGIQWNADGSLSNWQYDPVSGSLYSPSDAASIGHKTRKVKTKGGKVKEIKYYDIAAVEKKLWDLGAATVAWNRNLEKVADRAGGDVARALASMGNEGVALAAKMAKGTDKYVASMSIALRRMMQEARASLKDFTLQLDHATGNNQIFQNNLIKLAAMGYGDLASHLAAKGDQASMELAADAVGSRSKAAKANAAVKKAKAQLSSEEMESLIQIIAAITSKTVGIHQVADKTGIGEDVIIDVANKAKAQISKSLGGKAAKFLADLGKANKQQAYENGGIRAGLYATQGGIVRFAEPSTRGEAYIPLGANKRRTAMPVLADVASRFGVGLTDGRSGRVVIIREQGPLVGASHFHIGDRKSDRDLARAIEQRQAYQLRRLGRGGVGARG
jgi:hypothetical protein